MNKLAFSENIVNLRHKSKITQEQLADFLAVDRSAMSNELGKMRDDGLIEFEKNRFTLL